MEVNAWSRIDWQAALLTRKLEKIKRERAAGRLNNAGWGKPPASPRGQVVPFKRRV